MIRNGQSLIDDILTKVKKIPILWKHFNFSYKSQKYSLTDILPCIFEVLKKSIDWRYVTNLKTNSKNISWSAIYRVYIKLNKANIFEEVYVDNVKKYIKKCPNNKLKYILSDTTTIYNKHNEDCVKRNAYFKNKKVAKISPITDKYGVPLHIEVYSGNRHDSSILCEQLDNDFYINDDILDNNKKYFLADTGYDSKNIRDKLEAENMKPIIDYNIRNTKDENKIKKLTDKEEIIYKKRCRVENLFCKLKKNYRRCEFVYERHIKNYKGFLFMALFLIVKDME